MRRASGTTRAGPRRSRPSTRASRAGSRATGQLVRDYEDARELAGLDGGEMDGELAASLEPLRKELEELQEAALFDGEYDAGDAVVTLQSGTGGTDAQDWAEMMLRMYERWAANRGFGVELLEASPGEEAGIKSRHLHRRRRERLRDPQGRARASTGSFARAPSTRRTAAIPRSRP